MCICSFNLGWFGKVDITLGDNFFSFQSNTFPNRCSKPIHTQILFPEMSFLAHNVLDLIFRDEMHEITVGNTNINNLIIDSRRSIRYFYYYRI